MRDIRPRTSSLLLSVLACSNLLPPAASLAQLNRDQLEAAPHLYYERPLRDRFTLLKEDLASGKIALDRGDERTFLTSLLKVLDIPESSQLLVFSTTSLQLGLINPATPRALYFNEDLYLGYVPRGRIEIISIDPEAGGIFYIFDIPKGPEELRIERSNRCMNCHAGADSRHVPGLVVKSVVPGPSGGSLKSFRREETGHSIPYDQRFGGWYVTGTHGITNHWGNLTGRLSPQGLLTFKIEPGALFDFNRYPAPTSDILPHWLHEHQVGFINRAVEASYLTRGFLHESANNLTAAQTQQLDQLAQEFTRYILFADEPPFPSGGLDGDPRYKADFLKNRRPDSQGLSLKDFNLKTRVFEHRCSYMIHSSAFQGLPPQFKNRIYQRLAQALAPENPTPDFDYLTAPEKSAIRAILNDTLPEWAALPPQASAQ